MRWLQIERRTLISGVVVFAVACLVYANSLAGAFVSDDRALVLDHPYTKRWQDFPAIFRSGHYEGAGGYRPVTTASFALNYQLSGANPGTYHLVNIALHGLASVLVYLVFARLLGAHIIGLISALVFAVHPIHTEAVAWISGRAELLAAVFFLGSWLAYLRGAEGEQRFRTFFVSLGLFFAGLLSKENVLMLPLVLVAGDAYLLRREKSPNTSFSWLRLLISRWPRYAAFLVVVAVYFGLRSLLYPTPITRAAAGIDFVDNPLASADWSARFLTALQVLGDYFQLLVWPRVLSADYSFNSVPVAHNIIERGVIVGIVLLAAVLITAAVSFWRHGKVWLPIALGLLTILPTSNLIMAIGTIKAERLLYLPSVGFCVASAMVAVSLYRRFSSRPAQRFGGIILLGLILMAASIRTMARNVDWRSEQSLWAAAVKATPGNLKAQLRHGYQSLQAGLIDQAISAFQRALIISPGSEDALINLGIALLQKGRGGDAIALYERAVIDHPERATFRLNLGLAYAARGDILSAADCFSEAIKLKPDSAIGHLNLGLALSRKGDKEAAQARYQRAVELKPGYAEAWNALGAVSIKLGRKAEAREALMKAITLKPGYPDAVHNLHLLDTGP